MRIDLREGGREVGEEEPSIRCLLCAPYWRSSLRPSDAQDDVQPTESPRPGDPFIKVNICVYCLLGKRDMSEEQIRDTVSRFKLCLPSSCTSQRVLPSGQGQPVLLGSSVGDGRCPSSVPLPRPMSEILGITACALLS